MANTEETIKALRNYAEQKNYGGETVLANGILKAVCFIEKEENIPTVDEKEIIRKTVERIVERLEAQAGEFIDLSHRELSNTSITAKKYLNKGFGVAKAIEIVKEECGISE